MAHIFEVIVGCFYVFIGGSEIVHALVVGDAAELQLGVLHLLLGVALLCHCASNSGPPTKPRGLKPSVRAAPELKDAKSLKVRETA